ncbi:hypothetical protein J6590_099127 [Homalodisca vitripennis]|nr:hypothetical protein J6590_099127 [Homalodisca vitripennis]
MNVSLISKLCKLFVLTFFVVDFFFDLFKEHDSRFPEVTFVTASDSRCCTKRKWFGVQTKFYVVLQNSISGIINPPNSSANLSAAMTRLERDLVLWPPQRPGVWTKSDDLHRSVSTLLARSARATSPLCVLYRLATCQIKTALSIHARVTAADTTDGPRTGIVSDRDSCNIAVMPHRGTVRSRLSGCRDYPAVGIGYRKSDNPLKSAKNGNFKSKQSPSVNPSHRDTPHLSNTMVNLGSS